MKCCHKVCLKIIRSRELESFQLTQEWEEVFKRVKKNRPFDLPMICSKRIIEGDVDSKKYFEEFMRDQGIE